MPNPYHEPAGSSRGGRFAKAARQSAGLLYEDNSNNAEALSKLIAIGEKRDLTPAEEEIVSAYSLEDNEHKVKSFYNSDGLLASATAYHLTETALYVDHLGSLQPGGGKIALRTLLEEAQSVNKALVGQSTREAEGFYKHFGFTLDVDGNFRVAPFLLDKYIQRTQ